MKQFLVALGVCIFVSCAPKVDVSQFHLRSEQTKATSVKLVKAEAVYRFDHDIPKSERKKRLGHYYVVRWRGTEKSSPVTVRLNYLQADQGRTPKVVEKSFNAKSRGKAEFQVVGNDYADKGRVLAWRAEVIQNGQVVAYDESFLWSNNL